MAAKAFVCLRDWPGRSTPGLLDMTLPAMWGEEADATRRFTGKGLAGFLQRPYTAWLAEKMRIAGIPRDGRCQARRADSNTRRRARP